MICNDVWLAAHILTGRLIWILATMRYGRHFQ